MSVMDLAGIAALAALAGIPVSVLVAHWQKRTALQQTHALNQAARDTAEANHRAALAQAEADHRAVREAALEQAQAAHRNALEQAQASHRLALEQAEAAHRSAMAQAEANHRAALELQAAQARADHERWLLDARRASYDRFQECLGRFRTALLRGVGAADALDAIIYDMHSIAHEVRGVGPSEAGGLARDILRRCSSVTRMPGLGITRDEREEVWNTWIAPLRAQFSDSVHSVMTRSPALFLE